MEDKPKILIVDDKQENLVALELLLKEFDVEFIRALSGNEALAMTLKHEFALAIIDIQMPGMDGYETVELIHSDPEISYFPVIFVSAIHKDEYNIIKGIETGAVDFISKPIVPPILRGKVKVFLDLYEQRKLLQTSNEELKTAKEEAERNSFLKSLFLATMSHEIRTPMNGIIGVLDLLRRGGLNKEQEELINIIDISGHNLLSIINDILDFSKIEAGQVQLENTKFNIYRIIDEIVKLLKIKADERENNLLTEIDSSVPRYLQGDPLRLKQIIINLTNNALKFTKQGKVKIRVYLVSEFENKQKLRFEVIDNGIGISEEGQKKLFKSYSQIGESTQRQYGGTGLGLVISKNLVELMDGEIGVESEEGKGSTFWCTAVFGQSQDEEEGSKEATLNQDDEKDIKDHKLSILLVEDNKINQKVALASLRPYGHEVETAENGKKAIQMFAEKKYDLIIMDLQMPVMDGYAATKEIRKLEKESNLPATKIVALTANAFGDEKEKCLKLGMDDFITKPFKVQDLERILIAL
ncbi:MAG: response regulator [Bacteroidales bacterium]|nr:response regulator [Bacteroidales bacterium]MCF8388208.1 response regulator [Bacteroidales bacterium]MCF8399621.1 response regulator [Bacteroidales bacterium]